MKSINEIKPVNLYGNTIFKTNILSNGVKTIQDFNEAGFDMRPSLKGNNSVKDSIDYLKSLEIIVHPDSTNLQRELRSFRWAIDKEGKPIEGKVVAYNDDLIAAVRYGVYTHSRGQEVQLGFVRRSA